MCCNPADHIGNIARIATKRLNYAIAFADYICDCCRSGGYHNRHQQFVMAFLLEVTQVQSIVVHLIVCILAVFRIAALELQQENDVFVKHHCIYTLTHSGNGVFENDSTVRKRAQLVLENLHLRFPSVTLLDRRLRRNIVGVDDTNYFAARLLKELCNRRRIVGS